MTIAGLAPKVVNAGDTKILVVDMERLYGLARVWDQRTEFVPASQFVRLPSTLCFAAKFYGSKETEFHAAWDDHAAMVQRSWELYNEASIVVTYNGKRFDNPHFQGDWLLAGLPPPSPWKDVDLYQSNRFGFTSRSLNHLCQILGLDLKSGKYDMDMAEACMAGDAKAQKTMRKYNVGDVKITEQAYDRLRGYLPNHPHIGEINVEERRCNQCGSANLARNGITRAVVIDYVLYRCSDCGANVKGTKHSRQAATRGAR
jgi:hypothetical protein